MLRLLFLDIDGVLNSSCYAERYRRERLQLSNHHIFIDPDTVKRILRLCESDDVSIIISSSWRTYDLRTTKDDLLRYSDLVPLVRRIIGITPRLYKCRGQEIKSLLDHWGDWCDKGLIDAHYRDASVDSYVIIDDDDDMLIAQADYFVNVDDHTGITDSDIEKIRTIFYTTK